MRKYVRLNYFEVVLVPARQVLEAELVEEDPGDEQPEYADMWDMTDFLEFLQLHSAPPLPFDLAVTLGDEYADVERDSHIYDAVHNVFGLQVSKCRENNIPSKKRLGRIREEIMLDDDEYIGEFVSIIYDPSLGTLMVQSNHYGLSVKQLEFTLTELRFRYRDHQGDTEDEPLLVKLRPIIDLSTLDRALESQYYRKIRIRASDVMLDSSLGDDSLMSDVRRVLGRSGGINIDILVSVGRAERTASLEQREMRRVLEEFGQMGERMKPRIDVTVLQNEQAQIETINLVEPRMTDVISVEVEPRTTIAHEYLFRLMLEKYNQRRGALTRILVPQRG